jgi:hypothetical protein
MKNKPFAGVWLDHREALLFWADEKAEIHVDRTESGYQEEAEPTDRAPTHGPIPGAGVMAHASLDRRRKEQLNHYYKSLAKTLRPAEEIYLFGPGLAKKELAKAIQEHKDMAGKLKGVENADHMTEAQKAAQVRKFFKLPR